MLVLISFLSSPLCKSKEGQGAGLLTSGSFCQCVEACGFWLCYLFHEPSLRILPVLLGNDLILCSHVIEEPGQVHSGGGIHLHTDLTWATCPAALQFLETQSK